MLLTLLGALVLLIPALALGFWLGRLGRERVLRDQRAKIWQEGYDAAVNYREQQRASSQEQDTASAAYSTPPSPAPWPEPPPAQRPERDRIFDTTARPPQSPTPVTPPAAPVAQPWRPATAQGAPGGTGSLPPAPPAGAPKRPARVLSPRERELRNINITLYVAALLIVAAGAGFLTFALPPLAKVVLLGLIAVGFYLAGLITHARKRALRPAATAFAGTGLALLPLCAWATYSSLGADGPLTWFAYSLVSTLAFGYATVRLNSKILAWLAVAILISTAMASASVLQQSIMSYLLALLVLSGIFLFLLLRQPRIAQTIFAEPIRQTGRVLPLITALLAFLLFGSLGSGRLFWIFALIGAHTALRLALETTHRWLKLIGARLALTAAALFGMDYLGAEFSWITSVAALLIAGQAAAVAAFAPGYRTRFGVSFSSYRAERAASWALTLICVGLVLVGDTAAAQSPWFYLLVIPALLVMTLPALRQRALVEMIAVPLLALCSNAGSQYYPWLPLPALLVALLALGFAGRHALPVRGEWLAHLRWLLVINMLALLGYLAQWLSVGEGTETTALGVSLGLGLGFLGTLIWLSYAGRLLTHDAQSEAHHVARNLASLLGLVLVLAVLRALADEGSDRLGFLGLGAGWCLVFLALAGLGVVIRLAAVQARTRPGSLSHLAALATGALIFFGSFLDDYWWLAPVIAATNLVYYAVVERRQELGWLRVLLVVLGQVQLSLASWWTVYQLEIDIHGQLAIVASTVMVPQTARLIVHWRQGTALRVEHGLIAALLPVLLLLTLGIYLSGALTADRGTTMLLALYLVAHALVCAKVFSGKPRVALHHVAIPLGMVLLLTAPAMNFSTSLGWLRTSWYGPALACTLLVALAWAAILVEWSTRNRFEFIPATVTGLVVPLSISVLWTEGYGRVAAALGTLACYLALLVHTRRLPLGALLATMLVPSALYSAILAFRRGPSSGIGFTWDSFWTMIIAALLLFVAALLHGRYGEEPGRYRFGRPASSAEAVGAAGRFYAAGMLLALFVAGLDAHLRQAELWAVLLGIVLMAGAGLLVRLYEVPARFARGATDFYLIYLGALALSGYDRLVRTPTPSAALFYFAMLAALIVLRHLIGRRAVLAKRWGIATLILNSMALLSALIDGAVVVQVLVLTLYAVGLALGLVLSDKLYLWFSAVGITLSVMWFLRYLAVLWLVVIGAGLIVLAIRSLQRTEGRGRPEQGTPPPAQPMPPQPMAPMPPNQGAPPMAPPGPQAPRQPWRPPGRGVQPTEPPQAPPPNSAAPQPPRPPHPPENEQG
ncbi:hypothetical protein [Glutamicibacter sp. X7]